MTTKRILVIDNEQYIREVAEICLETVAGWQVVTAGSGSEGLTKAESEQPDAILLDVMMPDMNGPTTFQKLQASSATRHIPVILLTAKVQASDRRRYAELGMTATIALALRPSAISRSDSREPSLEPVKCLDSSQVPHILFLTLK